MQSIRFSDLTTRHGPFSGADAQCIFGDCDQQLLWSEHDLQIHPSNLSLSCVWTEGGKVVYCRFDVAYAPNPCMERRLVNAVTTVCNEESARESGLFRRNAVEFLRQFPQDVGIAIRPGSGEELPRVLACPGKCPSVRLTWCKAATELWITWDASTGKLDLQLTCVKAEQCPIIVKSTEQ